MFVWSVSGTLTQIWSKKTAFDSVLFDTNLIKLTIEDR